ncbi:MarR family transcriptional regulator [Corynebacterium hindlerae]|uniref:MarR family transcriptional regulator n=1 Tax=Corynebacterium hindlerae TaxID=699041 RepID=A0A7G5FCL3_9CORY|nr:helix-turn-helix domain-containing protein [Corynebacterium hindlerae]QMV84354.1 MarR family transcriptional regulator [Corynebacterium hindlerae]
MRLAFSQIFEKPATPAAQVLYHVRRSPHVGRGELVKATGLSQPTITRAVAALANAGLLRERRDLINTSRPGRPVVPLELASWPGAFIGVALDKDDAVIGCFDARGRLLREVVVSEFAQNHVCADVLEYIVAAIYRIKGDLHLPIKSIALSAASLHWNDFTAIRERLEFEFHVPTITGNAASALALAESQQDITEEDVLVLYSDNTTSAAYISKTGVSIPEASMSVDEWLTYLIEQDRPKQIVFSGSYFINPENRNRIRAQLTEAFHDEVKLRLTRPELETLRTITHALSLSMFNAHPLELAKA